MRERKKGDWLRGLNSLGSGEEHVATVPVPFFSLAAIGVLLLLSSPAAAHQLNVFAYVEGHAIRGEAYFRGRVPAQNAAVKVQDDSGAVLGQTTTDAEGKFHLDVGEGGQHKIIVETGDGHGGDYTLAADQFPADLPSRVGRASSPTILKTDPPPAAAAPLPSSSAQLDALRQQIIDLRRQLADYEDRTRLRDILGGIGYILGLAGLAAYFLAGRRPKQPTDHVFRRE